MRNLRILFLLVVFSTFAGYLIAPIEIRYIESLSPSYFWVGVNYALGAVLFWFLSRYVANHFNHSSFAKLIRVGAFFGICYPLLYAASATIFAYIGVKFIWVFSAVMMGPVLWTKLQEVLKKSEKPGRTVSYIYAVSALVGAFAQFLGGYLSDTYSMVYPFIVMGFVFFIIFLLSFFITKDEKLVEVVHKKETINKTSLSYILHSPVLIFYYILHTFVILCWEMKYILWPLIIFSTFKSDLITGTSFASMGVLAFFSLLIIGKYVDRISPVKLAYGSIFFLTISGMLFIFSTTITFLIISSVLYAFGESLYGPTRTLFLTNVFPSELRAGLVAFDESFHMIMAISLQFLVALSLDYFEPKTLLLFGLSLLFILGLVSLVYSKKCIQAYNKAIASV